MLHVANVNSEAHVFSAEVALLVPKWNGKDILRTMIAFKRLPFEGVAVRRSEETEAFYENCLV